MTKSSIKKYSLLGLVLVTASAVTTAMIPSKEKKAATGKLAFDSTSGGVQDQATCRQTQDVANGNCNFTAATTTTNPNVNDGHGTSADTEGSSAGSNAPNTSAGI